MNNIWIGIDTSNYTTSVAAIVSDGTYFNIKRPLCVKPNEKGVRQSDAVFMHVKNIPDVINELMTSIKAKYDSYSIKAVGVSTRPRPVEGSYMPCFLSGVSSAHSIALVKDIPLYQFSHQEGHIRASIFGAGIGVPKKFYSFHLSGGTCEFLETKKTEYGFESEIISNSADITLGQLVDRAGVLLGLPFPAGPHMEILARSSFKFKKIILKGNSSINLSGFENQVQKMIKDNFSQEEIAVYVYNVIVNAIKHMLSFRRELELPVIFAGGVSGSKIVKEIICKSCNAYFVEPKLSSDNALGIAVLAKEKYEKVFFDV